MRNEEIRKKLIKIAKGEGDIPLFVAADMNRKSNSVASLRCRL